MGIEKGTVTLKKQQKISVIMWIRMKIKRDENTRVT